MAVGAESFRRSGNLNQATNLTIKTTQYILESFLHRAKSIECEDITSCDFSSKFGLLKFFLSGKPISCMNLAGKWAPEAIKVANKGLSLAQPELTYQPISCASEVVKRMGGSEVEMAIVAGFAGGLGLSGNGCGALAAAVWKTILELVIKENWKLLYLIRLQKKY